MEEVQRKFCETNHYDLVVTRPDAILGYATKTVGLIPINGLRHPIESGISGWYVWCGELFSSEDDFFQPLHAKHLEEQCPEIIELLGLSPGHRFLKAGDYLDIWFDSSLLNVDNKNPD